MLQRTVGSPPHLQVDDGVCAVALHGVELQVSLEVLGIQPGDGKAVAEASLRGGREAGHGGGKRISPSGWSKRVALSS